MLGEEGLRTELLAGARALPARKAGSGGLPGRDQVALAVADQVGAAHLLERLAQQRPVLRIVVAQEGLVQPALLEALGREDLLRAGATHGAQGVATGVVHGRGQRHRARQEGLHLIGAEAVRLEPEGEVEHVLVGGAGVRGDEVRDQVLLLAGLARELLEHGLEAVVGADAGLHHLGERTALGMFGRDLQVAADMVGDQLLHIGGRFHRKVITQAGGDQHPLDARQGACLAVELDQRAVVGVEVLADVRVDAGQAAAVRLDLFVLAGQPVHVGGRPAKVRDGAGEALDLVADVLDLAQDGGLRTTLDDAPLVLGDRAEGAAAKAATHDVDREADHVPGGNLGITVGRMRGAGVGQVEHAIHLRRGQRDGRRVEPHVAAAMALHQRARVAGVGFQMQHARGMGVEDRIAKHLLVGRDAHRGQLTRMVARDLAAQVDHLHRLPLALLLLVAGGGAGHRIGIDRRRERARLVHGGGIQHHPAVGHVAVVHEGGAADVLHLARMLAPGDAVGDLDDGALGVAVHQKIGLGIRQHGAAHLVRPVVVMRDAAQAGLDAADDDRHVLVGLAAALGVGGHRAVGALAVLVVGGVGVVVAQAAVRGVVVHHRVHVARAHAEEQVGPAELAEGLRRGPVRLGDDADAEALRLQHAADHRHAEARVIDIGVAHHDDDVATVPAKPVHLRARHGQERRGAEAARPVRLVGKDVLGGEHGRATWKAGDFEGCAQ